MVYHHKALHPILRLQVAWGKQHPPNTGAQHPLLQARGGLRLQSR